MVMTWLPTLFRVLAGILVLAGFASVWFAPTRHSANRDGYLSDADAHTTIRATARAAFLFGGGLISFIASVIFSGRF
jgi:hypothetical protein